jgi:hypothetical protein
MALEAIVREGRFVIDESTDLPEGTELDLVVDDESEQFNPEERRAINAAIRRSLEDVQNGRTKPAVEILNRLRQRRVENEAG